VAGTAIDPCVPITELPPGTAGPTIRLPLREGATGAQLPSGAPSAASDAAAAEAGAAETGLSATPRVGVSLGVRLVGGLVFGYVLSLSSDEPPPGWNKGPPEYQAPPHWNDFQVVIFPGLPKLPANLPPAILPLPALDPVDADPVTAPGVRSSDRLYAAQAKAPEEAFVNANFIVDANTLPGKDFTALGFVRNRNAAALDLLERQISGEIKPILSSENIVRILDGEAPIVDDQWLKYHPGQKVFEGDELVHHHWDQGPWIVFIPRRFHEIFHKVLHPVTYDVFGK
jgi:hypothetical protein